MASIQRRQIFENDNNPINRQIIRQNTSLRSQQQGQSITILDRMLQFVSNFNLCLRPQSTNPILSKFLQKYRVISLYQDPYYGQCFALESKQLTTIPNTQPISKSLQMYLKTTPSFKQLISLAKSLTYKKEHKELKIVLEEIARYAEHNVLGISVVSEMEKQQFLFTKVQMYMAYDFILIDLEKEFQNRIIQKKLFLQSEIYLIVEEVTNALVVLQSANYCSLRMLHIYFCNYGRTIKLAHPKMFNYLSNLKLICKDTTIKGIYLSPQQLIKLQKNQIQSNDQNLLQSLQTSNSFTFGMILLSLMCNKYLNQVYDYRTCEINFSKIKQLLKNLQNTYSQRLITTVQKLLNPKISERLTVRQLQNVLEDKYQLTKNVQITLIKNKLTESQQTGYNLLYEQQPQVQHKNYLYGMIYPKISQGAQRYHVLSDQPDSFMQQAQIIANNRYSYPNSKYIGQSISAPHKPPQKQGKGMYLLPDGQMYIGEWQKNQMSGNGKLYFNNKKLRYQGQFSNGLFHGYGVQYANQQTIDRANQIDQTFVRLTNGSYIKYQGRWNMDQRHGPGKAYFTNGIWTGNFKANQPDGYGTWESANGKRKTGIWKDGYLEDN